MKTLGKIRDRGDDDFTVDDFDSMPYLVAVGKVGPAYNRSYPPTRTDRQSTKEILRIHPPAIEVPRVVTKDNVIPLSKPFVGVSGKVYTELPISTGTLTYISTVGYNLCVRPLVPHPRGWY